MTYHKDWWKRKFVQTKRLHIYMHPEGPVMHSDKREWFYERAGFELVKETNQFQLNLGGNYEQNRSDAGHDTREEV